MKHYDTLIELQKSKLKELLSYFETYKIKKVKFDRPFNVIISNDGQYKGFIVETLNNTGRISGHIQGMTTTMDTYIENIYDICYALDLLENTKYVLQGDEIIDVEPEQNN